MGVLIDGRWTEGRLPQETGKAGEFLRAESVFRNRITKDGSSGYKAEAGRYHLYVTLGCPWAHRTLIYRAIKGLEDAITVDILLPDVRTEGWTFGKHPVFPQCGEDSQHPGFRYLHQVYTACEPNYTGKVTVPTLWDKKTKRIVNNESSEIIRMLNSEFIGVAGNDADFYPLEHRAEIDRLNDKIYFNVNNGAYRCGFAQSQEAYEDAYDGLFATLDELDDRLRDRRFLCGNQPTEADWRLLPTMVRFDVAYFSLFKCNKKRIQDYTNLWPYVRDLCAWPGVMSTIHPRQYIANYYSIDRLNPPLIIPKGCPVDFSLPQDRKRLG
jgi:putative glutathione S-transferase